MDNYLILTLTAFLVSSLCGFLFIPIILNYCKQEKIYDIPNSRKVHKVAVPRLGGISFLPSMLIATLFALFFLSYQYKTTRVPINIWSLSFIFSLLIIYATGIIDDLIGVGAKIKFTTQIIAATILPLSGLYINNLYGLFGIYDIPFWFGVPLTIFVIVFIDNSINLIDGIDGLSAGLSFIALNGFLYYFLREGLIVYGILIGALMGVLLAFSYFNIFGKVDSKKIFMGDSGSLTLGFILGFAFVKYSMYNPTIGLFDATRMPTVYTLLIVPVFDTARVILLRIHLQAPIFDADKNHIHHKLMQLGLSQHRSLIVILTLAIFYILINNILFPIIGFTGIVLIDIAIYTLFHCTLNYYRIHHHTK